MDQNPYEAPQTEARKRLGSVPGPNKGTITGAILGGLMMPVSSVAAVIYDGSWFSAPNATDLVLSSVLCAVIGGCIGSAIVAIARLF
jgi:hypothetical protein